MVLGAGRGPLVRATFNAADITNTKVKVSYLFLLPGCFLVVTIVNGIKNVVQ